MCWERRLGVEILLVMFLVVASVLDLWKKEVPFLLFVGFFLIGVWNGHYLSWIFGIFFLFLGFITGQKIGYGDGCAILVAGTFLMFDRMIMILLSSIFMMGGVALFLMVVKKKGKDYEIPYIPMLFIGYLLERGIACI